MWILQGMLGVNRETSIDLPAPPAKPDRDHPSPWDLDDATLARQRESELCSMAKKVRIELDRHKNISSRAVLDKRIFHVPDAVNDKRVDHSIVDYFSIKSFAVAPLQTKDRVFGVVFVDNPDSGKAITREDLRFLQLFTSQSGIAIENSLLYGSLEEANRRLREAQDQLTSQLDMDFIESWYDQPFLIQALAHEDRWVRYLAADALANIGATNSVDSLISLLRDPEQDVRFAAAAALGKLGDPKAVKSLKEVLQRDNGYVRIAAEEALMMISPQGAGHIQK